MQLALQSSLFDHSERRDLGDGAWLEIRSGWLSQDGSPDDTLFDELRDTVPWRAERRQMYDRVLDVPRLVSFHDFTPSTPPHPRLKQLRRRLNDTYAGELGEPFTTAGLCLYRDGNDSVAWHGDTIGRSSTEDTMVAIVSLGADKGFRAAPARWRPVAAAAARPRRPAGDGRIVPAHLGARDPEDRAADGPADQHPVPPARRALSYPLTASTASTTSVAGPLRVDLGYRLVGDAPAGWR